MDFDLEVSTDGFDLTAIDGCEHLLSGVRIFQARMDRVISEGLKKIVEMGNASNEYDYNTWGGPNWKSKRDK